MGAISKATGKGRAHGALLRQNAVICWEGFIMIEVDQKRYIDVLRRSQSSGGEMRPIWNPRADRGYVYDSALEHQEHEMLWRDLKNLADLDYLEQDFFNRLTRCPSCGSHHLSVREVCVSCHGPNLHSVPLLHHFRCGYVGPIHAYGKDDHGHRICPKCHGTLEHLGTDHDHPGENWSCRSCESSFQVPDVEALCLSCGTTHAGANLVHEDVFSFRLSSLGAAALRHGRLFDSDQEQLVEEGTPIYRRSIFLSLIEDERRRRRRYAIPFGLVIVRPDAEDADDEDVFAMARRLAPKLRDSDKIGRLDRAHLLLLFPSTDAAGIEIALSRLISPDLRSAAVAVREGDDTVALLAAARARVTR